MKRILVLALLLLTGAAALHAQEKRDTIRPQQSEPGKQHKRGGNARKLATELGLSKEQSQQWKTLNQDFQQRSKAIKSDSALTTDQKKTKGRELAQERQKKINGILTTDQLAKYRQYQQELRKKVKEMKKEGAATDNDPDAMS